MDINSCLMLAVNLDCPISLKVMFDSDDLKDTGVEVDSHITLLYAQGRELPRKDLIQDIRTILGESSWWSLTEKIEESNLIPVLDVFELGCFENDSDYLILKLKPTSWLYNPLEKINRGLRQKYNVSSEFDNYTPHVSLAELNPGTAKKYLEAPELKKFLEDTLVGLEDIMISYGPSNEPIDRKQYFLTSWHSVDRFFRIQRLRNE